MKNFLCMLIAVLVMADHMHAQVGPAARHWKPWFITSVREYRLPAPLAAQNEVGQVLAAQQKLDAAGWQQMLYWNAGAPGYHWSNMMSDLWLSDTGYNGALANMLFAVATYDATLVAWDTKYAYNRARPFIADKRIKAYVPKPESPSYPCEYSVAAGVATTIIAHFFPQMADSVNRMAQQLMASRIASGTAFPGDTRGGFELGKAIAEREIERTKDFTPKTSWDGKMPQGPGVWTGKHPMYPLAGHNKTVVLDSSSQFRPAPPPDFAKDMAEMRNFKQTFRSKANAFYWASENFWFDALNQKMFEYNIHLNPPLAARLYALTAIGSYDGFVACWDAKYAYWGIRPDQYDTTWHPLIPTPPFPGYPSGHAAISGVMGDLLSYFFPADKAYFQKKARLAAESRFQAGIHFRTDNEVALDLGRKVAHAIIEKAKTDGSEDELTLKK